MKADTTAQRKAWTRLAFAWHGLSDDTRCDGTVWVHADGAVECTGQECGDPFTAFHLLTSRRPCRRDKPTAKQCTRCAKLSITMPAEMSSPDFLFGLVRQFLPGDSKARLDALLNGRAPRQVTEPNRTDSTSNAEEKG
ncbi:hypothetical protein [Streptomyces sp. NPDC048111]|uniref:hypothetical protein n=1 Tax=Streptomyces sp. NPDC048111 TaxID=3365500 RepID=UPI003712974B